MRNGRCLEEPSGTKIPSKRSMALRCNRQTVRSKGGIWNPERSEGNLCVGGGRSKRIG